MLIATLDFLMFIPRREDMDIINPRTSRQKIHRLCHLLSGSHRDVNCPMMKRLHNLFVRTIGASKWYQIQNDHVVNAIEASSVLEAIKPFTYVRKIDTAINPIAWT